MRRSRYSNGSILFTNPSFSSFDWCPIGYGSSPGSIAKPWDSVPASLSSDQLEYVHNNIGDGEDSLEGFGYISSFKTIFKFDVIPQENWNALEHFQNEIQKCYSKAMPVAPLWNTMGLWGPYYPKQPSQIETDLLVMVKFKGEFHRGCIVCQLESTSFYYVEILDYGHVAIIDRGDIYELAHRFVGFPVQPIRCCLNLPYRYLHFREWVDDPRLENLVAEIQGYLLDVGWKELTNLIEDDRSLEIEYVWKNVRKCGEPWMVNIKTKVERGSVDLVANICEKMDAKLNSIKSYCSE